MNSEHTTSPEQEDNNKAVEETDNNQVTAEENSASEGADNGEEHQASEKITLETEVESPDVPDAGSENMEAEESAVATVPSDETMSAEVDSLAQRVAELRRQERELTEQIAAKEAEFQRWQEAIASTQAAMGKLVQEGVSELEERKKKLQINVEQLERRSERIRSEMRTNFAGVSQDLAIRIQGFKDYLVGSLQELASAAEQLQLVSDRTVPEKSEYYQSAPAARQDGRRRVSREPSGGPEFGSGGFTEQRRQIRRILDQYRTQPDYYGPAWQLRRTFEPIHAERVSNWFFGQGGKGAVPSMGSRLQNILITSAVISVLRSLYGDRLRSLILVNSPERLGEWRRGLQDCLGISRSDFGSDRGIVLFEEPEPLAVKAERLDKQGELPLIVVDESENKVSLSMLQFPLWLAFAADPEAPPPMIY
ncbi:MAG: DUF3086 domain-containing protein [Hormoscilla sp.]